MKQFVEKRTGRLLDRMTIDDIIKVMERAKKVEPFRWEVKQRAIMQNISGKKIAPLLERLENERGSKVFTDNAGSRDTDSYSPDVYKAISYLSTEQVYDVFRSLLIKEDQQKESVQDERDYLSKRVEDLERRLMYDEKSGLSSEFSRDEYIDGRMEKFIDYATEFLEGKARESESKGNNIIKQEMSIERAINKYRKEIAQIENNNKKVGSEESPLPTKVSLGYGDLNGFKKVNDRFGHSVGDKIIRIMGDSYRKSAEECKDIFGSYIDVYRIGGDETQIIIENATDSEKRHLNSRVNQILQEPESYQDIDREVGENYRITTSIGFTDKLSLTGLFDMLAEYSEKRLNSVSIKELRKRKEEIQRGMSEKAKDSIYVAAEEEASKEKDRFYERVKDEYLKNPETLQKLEVDLIRDKSGRYNNRF